MIYENGITLTDQEKNLLVDKAWSQSKQIAKILKNRRGYGYTYQELRVALESVFGEKKINQDSVKRALSTMTGCQNAPESLKDDYGRWPLVKADKKRLNPETGKKIHVYLWNDRYNQHPTASELRDRYKDSKQMDAYDGLFAEVGS